MTRSSVRRAPQGVVESPLAHPEAAPSERCSFTSHPAPKAIIAIIRKRPIGRRPVEAPGEGGTVPAARLVARGAAKHRGVPSRVARPLSDLDHLPATRLADTLTPRNGAAGEQPLAGRLVALKKVKPASG